MHVTVSYVSVTHIVKLANEIISNTRLKHSIAMEVCIARHTKNKRAQRVRCMHVYGECTLMKILQSFFNDAVKCASNCAKLSHS